MSGALDKAAGALDRAQDGLKALKALDGVDEHLPIATRIVQRELGNLSVQIDAAEVKALNLRKSRDALLAWCYSVGLSVTTLAKDADLSRQSVYQGIRRHQLVRDEITSAAMSLKGRP